MDYHGQQLQAQHPEMMARNGLTPAEQQDVPRPVAADSLAERVWQQVGSPPHAEELLEPDVSPIRESTPTPSEPSMLDLDQSDDEGEADANSYTVELAEDERRSPAAWRWRRRMWILEASTAAAPLARYDLQFEVDRLAGQVLISEDDMRCRAADIHVFTFFDRRFLLKAAADVDPEVLTSTPEMHAYLPTWPRWKIESERSQAEMRSARAAAAEAEMLLSECV